MSHLSILSSLIFSSVPPFNWLISPLIKDLPADISFSWREVAQRNAMGHDGLWACFLGWWLEAYMTPCFNHLIKGPFRVLVSCFLPGMVFSLLCWVAWQNKVLGLHLSPVPCQVRPIQTLTLTFCLWISIYFIIHRDFISLFSSQHVSHQLHSLYLPTYHLFICLLSP
jgi:hypothetical protein